MIENCEICLDDKSIHQFFSVEGCTHRYCYSCIKQHVEVKLLNGVLPKCPHEGCVNVLRIESCEKFLNPKVVEMMRQQVKEESIPVTEKVYCPYPKCSTLMSKTELLINEIGAVTCYKCHGSFCVDCMVPWHKDMNCEEYKRRNPTLIVEESKLKSLAARNLWRQCIKCKHMIELAAGCYHMTCRCGYEFCYTCGAEWKNKKATCTSCPLQEEENIMDIEEEEDEVQEDDDDDFEDEVNEDDDHENDDVHESDDFEDDVVLEDADVHVSDDFEEDVVVEGDDSQDDVLEEEEEEEEDTDDDEEEEEKEDDTNDDEEEEDDTDDDDDDDEEGEDDDDTDDDDEEDFEEYDDD